MDNSRRIGGRNDTYHFQLPTSYFLLPTSYFLLPVGYFFKRRKRKVRKVRYDYQSGITFIGCKQFIPMLHVLELGKQWFEIIIKKQIIEGLENYQVKKPWLFYRIFANIILFLSCSTFCMNALMKYISSNMACKEDEQL